MHSTGKAAGRGHYARTPKGSRDLPSAMNWQAETYDSWFDEPWGKYAYSVELASALHALGDLAGCRVLDAGCGTGRLLASLSSATTEAAIVGVDRGSAMLGVALGKKLGPLVQGDIMALPFPRAEGPSRRHGPSH
ncbi:MAG: class I SAM-dependent methyltransferase [Acidimicrobiales bacterium]